MNPTRFPGGLNTSEPTVAMAGMGQLDPSQFHSFFNDFDVFTAADWTITETGAAGTVALQAGDGGQLLITTDALDNDAEWIQNTVASFLMESGKKAFFKMRFQVSEVTQCDIQVGLVNTDTTPLDATDGIFFQKDDGDANLDIYVQKNTTTGRDSATAVSTLTADTWTTLAWYYDGVSTVSFFKDDVLLDKLSGSSTYLPDANLAVSFGYQNGQAGAETMTVDYIFVAKER